MSDRRHEGNSVEEKGAEQEHQTEGCKCHSHAILMHGCETLSLSKQQHSRVQATQKNALRRIEGITGKWFRYGEGQAREMKMRMEKTSMERTAKRVLVGKIEGKTRG